MGPTRYHQVLKETRTSATSLPNNRLRMSLYLSVLFRVDLPLPNNREGQFAGGDWQAPITDQTGTGLLALSELKTGPSLTARRSREAVG